MKPTAVGGMTSGSVPNASRIVRTAPDARHDHAASASAIGVMTIVLIAAIFSVKRTMERSDTKE